MRNFTISFLLLVFLTSCKTQEEIRKEQMVDNLALQMVQNQKLSADVTVRIQNLENKLSQIIGQMEEEGHQKEEKSKSELEKLKERVTILEEGLKNSQDQIKIAANQIEGLNEKSDEHRGFIDEVLNSLKTLSKQKKLAARSPYDKAMNHYRRGRYKKARAMLEDLEKSKNVKGNRKARVLHNLGMIAFMDKRFGDATVLFSRLFTQYPKAPYVPNGLLFMAKSFERLKKSPQAKAILGELMGKYPKARQVKEAKVILKRL